MIVILFSSFTYEIWVFFVVALCVNEVNIIFPDF